MGKTASGRLLRVSTAVGLGTILVMMGLVALQIVLVSFILPSLMGIHTSAIKLTMQSMAWIITSMFCFFLLFDFYWTIASVFVFYDQQSRRLGVDLRLRLGLLQGAQP